MKILAGCLISFLLIYSSKKVLIEWIHEVIMKEAAKPTFTAANRGSCRSYYSYGSNFKLV